MKKIPSGQYTKEFREEAARVGDGEWLVGWGGGIAAFSAEVQPLENWVRTAKAGKLGDIGKPRGPLTEVEMDAGPKTLIRMSL